MARRARRQDRAVQKSRALVGVLAGGSQRKPAAPAITDVAQVNKEVAIHRRSTSQALVFKAAADMPPSAAVAEPKPSGFAALRALRRVAGAVAKGIALIAKKEVVEEKSDEALLKETEVRHPCLTAGQTTRVGIASLGNSVLDTLDAVTRSDVLPADGDPVLQHVGAAA